METNEDERKTELLLLQIKIERKSMNILISIKLGSIYIYI